MIIPLLLKQYRETTVATLRKSNLDVIIELLEACRTLYGSSNEEKGTTAEGLMMGHTYQQY
jgi:DNA repair/transcription protein MET18/MMS19